MYVKVKLYGNLKRFAPNKKESAQVKLNDGATVRALLLSLGVPENNWWMAAVNDQVVDEAVVLKEGDEVEVFEPVGGGSWVVRQLGRWTVMIEDFPSDDLSQEYKPVDPKQMRLTRRLAILWAVAGISLFGILCYFLVTMIAALNKGRDAARVGLVADFPLNSVQIVYINPTAEFDDPVTSKAFDSLALDVVRDDAGNFHIFFARSTNPFFGVRAPRDCIVKWQEATQQFEEPCSGAKWSREGKWISGPAPRDLDEFPPQIRKDELWIGLELVLGAAPNP